MILSPAPKEFLMDYRHQPVLTEEIIGLLVTDKDGLYLDATLGLGGHSEALLRALSPKGKVLGMDMDPEALASARQRLKDYPGRFFSRLSNFRDLANIVRSENFFPLSGALFDVGVSSLQFDKGERGFSFSKEGPLDMRMSPESPLTAGAIVNSWPSDQLAILLREFGEEAHAERISRAIEARRRQQPFQTTTELANLIESLLPRSGGIHPATRTFQALRIAVNAELENLAAGLEAVLPLIGSGGRLAVVSFHSLEDRIVKSAFSSFVERGLCRYLEEGGGKQALRPSEKEAEKNPRSRSAKLRLVEKP